ncbi:NADPH-dependent aldehyde reductase Ahr [Psychrobacter pygoscelis]|uniref:NADPH-dependent aldehyde reductase Ahr n=1 Tax=Psychrobacter pygoscelis TaxID=2488563 RepID=UPI00103F0B9D
MTTTTQATNAPTADNLSATDLEVNQPNNQVRAYAAMQAGGELERYDFDAGELKIDEVEIAVSYCGICHSDLSVIDNDWGMSQYPVIAGHEIVGQIIRMGEAVKGLQVGQTVGIGWTAESCQHCDFCIDGKANVCRQSTPTIVGHSGGFADKVRAQWQWVIPLPAELDESKAGPLMCGGITVFRPIIQHQMDASKKVGVIGIGGLGHMALDFLNAWGCEVTAFSSSPEKYDAIREMGAHHIIDSKDADALKDAQGSLDLIISTVNVALDWNLYLSLLKPEGKLHYVGAVLKPLDIQAFNLIGGAKSVAGSPTGSAAELRQMVKFAARAGVEPITETYPMSQINEAMTRMREGKARYRIVLENDFE